MPRFLAALALVCAFSPASASDTTLTLPFGDWVLALAQWLGGFIVPALVSLAAGYAAAAIARVYPWAVLFLSQRRVEMMIQAGADYALNAVRGAAKGKTLSVMSARR